MPELKIGEIVRASVPMPNPRCQYERGVEDVIKEVNVFAGQFRAAGCTKCRDAGVWHSITFAAGELIAPPIPDLLGAR